ncbi:MAG: M23 family metallopeptidase [Deltaproteobacteria bacterium]|nr:M23 family metallopeptidase [Deltaproteobacteria bacterium]
MKWKWGLLPIGIGLTVVAMFPAFGLAAGHGSPTVTPQELYPGGVALLSVAETRAGRIFWEGKTIPLVPLPDGRSSGAFLPLPQEAAPGPREAELWLDEIGGSPRRLRVLLRVLPKEFPTQRLTLPESQVTLSESTLARHRSERQAVAAAHSRIQSWRLWKTSFRRPIPGPVTTPFGVRRILNGKPRRAHSGVDLGAPLGEPVTAAADGLVILTGDHFFSGQSVYLDHGMGVVSCYFHLSGIHVRPGEAVAAGDPIGRVGSTGRSTAPHLHWGVSIHGVNVDPFSLLSLFTIR